MPRKGENIYKRKDGRWEGRYIKKHSGSKAKYGYIYGKTYSEVKKKLNIKRAETDNESNSSLSLSPKDVSFEEIAVLWLAEAKSKVKESTWIKYYNMLYTYILPNIGKSQLYCIDYNVVHSLCMELLSTGGIKQQGLSSKTVSDTLTIIKSIIKYASQLKYNPDRSVLDVTIKLKPGRL